jgi:CubicO group peptidase (beta-lactamase class C family)
MKFLLSSHSLPRRRTVAKAVISAIWLNCWTAFLLHAQSLSSSLSSSLSLSLSSSFTAKPVAVPFKPAPVPPPYNFAPVEKLLNDSLAKFDGGCALFIVQNGTILLERGFGNVSVDSVMPIASASKWLSGALLMTLVDAREVSLTDGIGTYLQYLTGEKARITIRDLFTHTSGFTGEVPAMRNMKSTLKDAAYNIATSEELKYETGTAFAYGGASMQIGGRIVEIAAKKSWEVLFQERIAQPLGMKHTTFHGLGKTANPLLAGGAQSSAREYMYFLQMLVNGGILSGRRILSENAVATLHSNHTAGLPVLKQHQTTSATLINSSESAHYGLGMWLICNDKQPHETWELNSQGRFGFSPWIDLRRGVCGILATRTPLRSMNPTYRRLKALLREIIPPLPNAANLVPQINGLSAEPVAGTLSATTATVSNGRK